MAEFAGGMTGQGERGVGTHLHFDCFSGVSGDMVLGALLDAGLPADELIRALSALRVEGYKIQVKRTTRGGVRTTKLDVVVRNGFRAALSLARIRRIIDSSDVPKPVREVSHAVFDRLAQAEAVAHGVPPEQVHFHEVGVIDSIVDVVGSLLGCHLLGVTRYSSSPVNLGSGFLTFSHGRLPVPGPAVAALARGVPVYSTGPERELTTPTGMALVATLAKEFGPLPLLQLKAVGYGAGSADPKGWANALRIFLGDYEPVAYGSQEMVVQLETNLDDLQPQAYEGVIDRLVAGGALDVTLTPVIMKRGRPGIVLGVLASREKADAVARIIFRETTALGVRMQEVGRRVLPRRIETVRISGGDVRVKIAEVEPGAVKAAPEFRDCLRVAEQSGRPVREVMEEAVQAFRAQGPRTKEKGKRKKQKGNGKK